jgi:hypothetical protein
MTSPEPDTGIRVPLLRQAWCMVTFVHWRYDKSLLQPMLPPGLTVDERDGSAWVTLVALQLRDVRLPGTPPVPQLSTFPQTNLRTYVRGPGGKEGIWLFLVGAARTWITIGARLLLGAPYVRADLAVGLRDGIRYLGTRPGHWGYQLDIQPGQPISPPDLDIWLTHRWRAYTHHAGCLLEIPVSHEPWPLRGATVTMLDQSLTTAAGLPTPPDETLVHYSDGVTGVAFGAARPVSGPRAAPLSRRPR